VYAALEAGLPAPKEPELTKELWPLEDSSPPVDDCCSEGSTCLNGPSTRDADEIRTVPAPVEEFCIYFPEGEKCVWAPLREEYVCVPMWEYCVCSPV
jgi:hypothetical protein